MTLSLPIEEQERLTAALKGGSAQAFEQLYRQLHRPIYNLAVRLVGDRDAAADITQDVFLDAYQQLPRHDRELRLEPWLYRIAVNTCYDHLRRRSARPSQSLSEIGDVPALGDESTRWQLAAAVSATITRLSPRYRTALVLKDLHGFSNTEIASVLGIRSNAAAVLLFRARRAFRQAFRELVPADGIQAGIFGLAVLPTLAVPSWLETPPAFAALSSAASGPPAVVEALGGPLMEGSLATGSILAKVGALLTSKAAVASLSIALLGGGSIAMQSVIHDGSLAPPLPASLAATPSSSLAKETASLEPLRFRRQAAQRLQRSLADSRQSAPGTGAATRSGAENGAAQAAWGSASRPGDGSANEEWKAQATSARTYSEGRGASGATTAGQTSTAGSGSAEQAERTSGDQGGSSEGSAPRPSSAGGKSSTPH